MVIVDSDIIIWLLRGDRQVSEQFRSAVVDNYGSIFVTPVQVAEIFAGIRPGEKDAVDDFFESLGVLHLDERSGRMAGGFMNEYGKSHNVTIADALIAAVARINGCLLWTKNIKHYPMFGKDGFYNPA